MQFGLDNKNIALFIGSSGSTTKSGLGYLVNSQDIVTEEAKEIEINTIIEITYFNFSTNKVRLRCIKGIHSYQVEVDYKYILDCCAFQEKKISKAIESVYVKSYSKKVLDKETLNTILMVFLVGIIGIFLGKVL